MFLWRVKKSYSNVQDDLSSQTYDSCISSHLWISDTLFEDAANERPIDDENIARGGCMAG